VDLDGDVQTRHGDQLVFPSIASRPLHAELLRLRPPRCLLGPKKSIEVTHRDHRRLSRHAGVCDGAEDPSAYLGAAGCVDYGGRGAGAGSDGAAAAAAARDPLFLGATFVGGATTAAAAFEPVGTTRVMFFFLEHGGYGLVELFVVLRWQRRLGDAVFGFAVIAIVRCWMHG